MRAACYGGLHDTHLPQTHLAKLISPSPRKFNKGAMMPCLFSLVAFISDSCRGGGVRPPRLSNILTCGRVLASHNRW